MVERVSRCRWRSATWCALLLVMSVATATSGMAQSQTTGPPPAISYASLSALERDQLKSFAAEWDSLPPERQQLLRRKAARWAVMTAEQRQAAEERFRRWQALPPEQRAAMRERSRTFHQLPADQQQRVRRGLERFRDLPQAERQRLREEFRRMSPQERREFLHSAAAQRHSPWRERWLQSLPEAEQAPTRAMLDAFTPEQRRILKRTLRAAAQQQRDEIRRELLKLEPAARVQRLQALAEAHPGDAAR